MPKAVTLENDALRLSVSPQGGAILTGHTQDGRAFLRSYEQNATDPFDATRAACFPMVPICNRTEGNGFDFAGKHYVLAPNTGDPFYLHGDGWLSEWKNSRTRDQLTLTFVHVASERSPYGYRATQTITLDGSTVRINLAVENLGADALPFGIGFHPYFSRTPDVCVEAPAQSWWTEGADHLPVSLEALPPEADFSFLKPLPDCRLNNGYEGWNQRARIVWPESNLVANIKADATFSRYMLYAPDSDPSFFCLEPMSHAPNALAKAELLGLQVLHTGETLAGGFTISMSNWSEPNG